MGMRLPGGVHTAEEFWDLLISKKDCSSEVPKSRYNVDAFYDPDRPQSVRTRRGYFLDDSCLGNADTAFFQQIPGFGASELDPQQMMLMEVVWECMENAGQTEWRGKDIGCYVGVFGEDWHELTAKESQAVSRVHAFANGGFALANRVSYVFDLKGPSVTVMTACSSSLMALHEACQALSQGNCSSAIVCGTNMLLTPSMTVTMSENMVLSPDGYCKAFDANANGYARGEAVNAVYIKTLQQALSDGDNIRAVIRGTSANYDGRTDKIFAPDIDSQERLIRQAYRQARIDDIGQTAFVECHGTGTKVGDLVEATAVARIFRPHGVYIGSGASGLTGFIKAVLALEHRMIPPNMHFTNPNPKIPFKEAGLQVPTEPIPWPANRKYRVSVNCFGIGGSNVHVIVESLESPVLSGKALHRKELSPRILFLSAQSKPALETRRKIAQKYVENWPERVSDLGYTLAVRRDHLSHRAFLITGAETTEVCEHRGPSTTGDPNVVFLLTGQGSAWQGMGRELMERFPAFTQDIRLMDRTLQEMDSPPGWGIEDTLRHLTNSEQCWNPEYSQTLTAAIQLSLVNMLRSWGIQPGSVIGHSSGEVVAAYAANAVSMRTAITIAHLRGRCVQANAPTGGMVVLGLNAATVRPYLVGNVVISCENSPESVNISGSREELDMVTDRIRSDIPDAFIRDLPVQVAYHSPDMQRTGEAFKSSITPYISHNDSMLPMYSTVTSGLISSPTQLDAAYWQRNLESPVLFAAAVQTLLSKQTESTNLFVEIGPHASLAGSLREIFRDASAKNHYIHTLVKDKPQISSLFRAVGELFLHHYPINFQALIPKGQVLCDIPVYPWDRKSVGWNESRLSQNWRFRRHRHHELLGSRTLEASDLEPAWRNLLTVQNVNWLNDHRVLGEIVFPCAAYIAMIVEAVRQLFDTSKCIVQNLFIRAPLILQPSDSVELVTTAKPVGISDRVESAWYEFSISSYVGTSWTRHAVGQAKAWTYGAVDPRTIRPFPRSVSSVSWYNALANAGLEYGPRFQGLEDITADPLSFTANATLQSSSRIIYPTTIDQCLQLISVAACRGRALQLDRLYLPVSIAEIMVGPSQPLMKAEAWGTGLSGNQGQASVMLVADGNYVLSMRDITLVEFANTKVKVGRGAPLASYGVWKPDIDLISSEKLFCQPQGREDELSLVNSLSALSVIQICRLIADIEPVSEPLRDYKTWIQKQSRLPEAGKWVTSDDSSLSAEREKLDAILKSKKLECFSRASEHVLNSTLDVFRGGCPVDSQSGTFQEIEDRVTTVCSLTKWFSLLGHSNPAMWVLEIGAEQVSFSSHVLQSLTSAEEHLYSHYSLTGGNGIDSTAKERLKDFKRVEFKKLDINSDPIDQGFGESSYDLVIASDLSSHVGTPKTALQHIKKLLAPHGRLLLREQCYNSMMRYMYIPRLSSQKCAEAVNGRCMSLDDWDNALRAAGFEGIQADDRNAPYPLYCHIISRAREKYNPEKTLCYLLCLSKTPTDPWINEVEAVLAQKGCQIRRCTLREDIPQDECVISLLDCGGPFFNNISEHDWKSFQSFIGPTRRLLWATPSVELSCSNPDFALVLGVSRTARQEQRMHFGTFQVDSYDNVAADALAAAASKFFQQTASTSSATDVDYEFSLRKGVVCVPRMHWTSLDDQLLRQPNPEAPIKLDMDLPGTVNSLLWSEDPPGPLGPHDVSIDIKYVGLNFRDIMVALGVMGNKSEFGMEASAVVQKCGDNVQQLKPGDRVIVTQRGLLCTTKVVPAAQCAIIPDSLELQDAASMGVVYTTALYCLLDIARLEKGQSVLIHAACGGVGLAAIQVCQMIGAEIYATVGNEEKRVYLREKVGISGDHIFSSRNDSFLSGLMHQTKGRGVDVVLNSLTGELLHASWKCVAEFGKMIEIGKRDFLEHGNLPLEAFGGNRMFVGVDLIGILEEKPKVARRLVNQLLDLYQQGRITPIRPLEVVAASQLGDSFRRMQQGTHMGKIVAKMPESHRDVLVAKSPLHLRLSPDLSYMLIGGLGGVGRALATWMVERGARHLVFLSRGAGASADDQCFVRELEMQGCNTMLMKGDVTRLVDITAAIKRCPLPVGGVLQLSMVIKDQFIPDMTYKNWQDGLAAKVTGTWNLHHALQGNDTHLQFFVVCGSITGVMGNAGQVNYCSGNAFVSSFVQYRLQKGLPASVVNLGGVNDMGFLASQDTKLRNKMRAASVRLLKEQEVLDAFEIAMSQSRPRPTSSSSGSSLANNLIVGMSNTRSLADPSVRPLWGNDARFRAYANLDINRESSEHSPEAGSNLRRRLAAIREQPTLLDNEAMGDQLATDFAKVIQEYSIFAQGLSHEQVAKIPFDSLMTVEIRNWSVRYFNLDLSLVSIAKAGTIEGLARFVMSTMRSQYSGAVTLSKDDMEGGSTN
ncbi:hypothetical protein BDW59DRAFT_164156 [Aspergillus cavernicola]|uniref:Polyketide synthase n=1 Tax=Aspergillus cavernicola TaxID=176166 RepID=A0ABR4I100_9EURO